MEKHTSAQPASPIPVPVSPKQTQCRCCYGLAAFTRAMQEGGKTPRCFGVQALKDGDIVIDGARELSASTADFKYYCLGFSVYPEGSTSASVDPDASRLLPYCEGIELTVLEEPNNQTSAGQPAPSDKPTDAGLGFPRVSTHRGTSTSGASTSEDGDQKGWPEFLRRLRKHSEQNLQRMVTAVKDDLPAVVQQDKLLELQGRFTHVLTSYRDNMASTVASMYGYTHSLLNKLISGRDNDNGSK